ncbi:MAG: MFS transporter [Betaproteobacteria bacterium]|jgi:MFS family permease|nr:MFS transporter [Betaproteobacteria bacterium]
MEIAKRNVVVLAACQALLFTNNSTLIALNGLVGYAIAPDKRLATLPVTGWVIGAALTTFFASLLMKRIGRRAGFMFGTTVGIVGALICSTAIYLGHFWLFCSGTVVFGVYNAFGQYYRFAAADTGSVEFRSKAISFVVAGGLVGGILGPTSSRFTMDLLPTMYLGAYLALIGILVLVLLVLTQLRIPLPSEKEAHEGGRPLLQIMKQPAYIVAVVAAGFGYGIMNLLMTATPLAMGVCGHPYSAAATVISWHVIGMFAPSFFTGSLVKRFGVLNMMMAGVALNLACVAIAIAGVDVANFWFSLVLLGVGWNFLFISGTTLLTETYRPEERAKAQGANDLTIFIIMATSSFASGVVLEASGWNTLNFLALPFIGAVALAVVWLMLRRRALAAPRPA